MTSEKLPSPPEVNRFISVTFDYVDAEFGVFPSPPEVDRFIPEVVIFA